MPQQILLLSGNVSSGKTTLSESLRLQYDHIYVLKTKVVIKELARKKLGKDIEAERRALQEFGTRLDEETKGQWVRDALRKLISKVDSEDPEAIVVIDAVRIREQIKAIRKAYGYLVRHIHLKTPLDTLERRYKRRKDSGLEELGSFSDVAADSTEVRVGELEKIADAVIDTKLCTKKDVLAKASRYLVFHARDNGRLVDVVVGGQYGSEGKGHIVSYLAREYSMIVRVGGPNAGHKVFFDEGPYTHHQLPSGTLRTNARLLIGPGATVNVERLMKEIAECNVNKDRLFIDPQAMVISKEDIEREAGLKKRISSTGQGVGFATARRITDRGKQINLAGMIPELKPFTQRKASDLLEEAYCNGDRILVEGTQGIALSIYHGQYPYVTSRDTSTAGALAEAGIPPTRTRKVVMVCRTFPIRVQDPKGGTSGPLEQEISWATVAKRAGLNAAKLNRSERTSTTDRRRRVGEFDWDLLRQATVIDGPTDIALTFTDYLDAQNEQARRYEQLTTDTIKFIGEVERVAKAPVSLISTRFDFRSIIDRRRW
jgi:adenylosuccinate synthase